LSAGRAAAVTTDEPAPAGDAPRPLDEDEDDDDEVLLGSDGDREHAVLAASSASAMTPPFDDTRRIPLFYTPSTRRPLQKLTRALRQPLAVR